jgi:hypothetical protein
MKLLKQFVMKLYKQFVVLKGYLKLGFFIKKKPIYGNDDLKKLILAWHFQMAGNKNFATFEVAAISIMSNCL